MRLLGKGDVGNVFLVQATGISQLKGLFAMKVYKKSDVIERKKVNRVKLEREILQQTSHPFLVSMYAAFQTPSRLYVVLQYCQGGEFFRFLRKQPNQRISEEWARFYAAEVLCALEYLHFLGKQGNLTDGCKNTTPPHPTPPHPTPPHTDPTPTLTRSLFSSSAHTPVRSACSLCSLSLLFYCRRIHLS